MRSIIAVVVGAVLVLTHNGITSGQILPLDGQCANHVPIQNFNLTEYMGQWYEIKRVPTPFEANGDCVIANYDLLENNKTIEVKNSMKILSTNENVMETGYAEPFDQSGSGRLVVTFNVTNPNASLSNYYILASDYINYSIVWSCSNVNTTHYFEFIWILSRTRELSAPANTQVASYLTAHFNLTSFRETEQREEICNGSSRLAISGLLIIMATFFMKFIQH